jgi:hypothetical protein
VADFLRTGAEGCNAHRREENVLFHGKNSLAAAGAESLRSHLVHGTALR